MNTPGTIADIVRSFADTPLFFRSFDRLADALSGAELEPDIRALLADCMAIRERLNVPTAKTEVGPQCDLARPKRSRSALHKDAA